MPAHTVSSSPSLVQSLQERAARAIPAEHVEQVDGWWLRYAAGCTWWAGTALPHGDVAPDELVGRVVDVERFYTAYGTTARFQITPRVCPEALDARLSRRGYRRESPMSLQVATTAQIMERAPANELRIRLDGEPTGAWFEAWRDVHGLGGDVDSEWRTLRRVEQPAAYASALIADRVVAVGRVVADDGWAGVFNMATLPSARGKGAARSVLVAMARWADSHDADGIYLQVESDNAPACRLYGRMGFAEVCGYHYRAAAGS